MAQRAIFYDTETTGIKSDKDRIIELAAYDSENQKSFTRLINPKLPIPSDATAIHGITNEMVASAPTFGEVAREFIEFCQGEVILIAHNNDSFDLPFMRCEFDRHEVVMPSWSFLDSLKWARRYRPDLPRHTLQSLRELYGIAKNNAHRALDDVLVLYEVFSRMTDDLSIQEAFNLLSQPKELSHMPFGKFQGKALEAIPKDYVQWLAKSGALDKPDNKELQSRFLQLGFL